MQGQSRLRNGKKTQAKILYLCYPIAEIDICRYYNQKPHSLRVWFLSELKRFTFRELQRYALQLVFEAGDRFEFELVKGMQPIDFGFRLFVVANAVADITIQHRVGKA